jgi:hypothetical protein
MAKTAAEKKALKDAKAAAKQNPSKEQGEKIKSHEEHALEHMKKHGIKHG